MPWKALILERDDAQTGAFRPYARHGPGGQWNDRPCLRSCKVSVPAALRGVCILAFFAGVPVSSIEGLPAHAGGLGPIDIVIPCKSALCPHLDGNDWGTVAAGSLFACWTCCC